MLNINVNVTVDAGPRIAPVLEMVVGEVLSRINEREAPKRRPRKEETAAEQEAPKRRPRKEETAAEQEAPKRRPRKEETAAEQEATEAVEEPHIEVVVLPDAAPAAEPAQAPAPEPAQAAAPAAGEAPKPIDAETLRARIADRVNVLVRRNQSPSVRALLTRYNKGRVSELAEDQLGEFLLGLQKIGE